MKLISTIIAAATLLIATSASAATPLEFESAVVHHLEVNMNVEAPVATREILLVRYEEGHAGFEVHDAYGNVLNINCNEDSNGIACFVENAELPPVQDDVIGGGK